MRHARLQKLQRLRREWPFYVFLCYAHRIRDSKHETIPGIPDELYYFPEKSGGVENLAMPVANDQIQYVEENLLQFHEEQNLVQEYFEHIFENSGLVQPVNWQEAEQLYFTLMAIANGT